MKGNTKGRTREGGTSVRGRHGSGKANRLAARVALHAEFPVRADGKEGKPDTSHPAAKRPGSVNPAKR